MRFGVVAIAALVLSGTTAEAGYFRKAAAAGKPLKLYQAYSVNPDCSSFGNVTVKMTEQPSHGRVSISPGGVFPNFPASNVRSRCNTRRVAGVIATYTAQRGYQGHDRVAIEVIFPAGAYQRHEFGIVVR